MLALIERAAIASLCRDGLEPDQAAATLAKVKPAATYNGARYYDPISLMRAADKAKGAGQ